MKVNFVMSSYVDSPIFNHMIEYLKSSGIKAIKTVKPIQNADIYCYFRPHLEEELKSPSVVTVHHDLTDSNPDLHIEKFLKHYRKADAVVCLNSNQQNMLADLGVHNTVIIPHGYNSRVLSDVNHAYKENSQKKTIGFFSHKYSRNVKGEGYLLELASKLSSDKYSFILVGKKRDLLCDDLRSLGFECQSFEFLPYSEFSRLYSLIDVLLITSNYEGGPASLPESLASGVPVFMTDVGMACDLRGHPYLTIMSGNADKDMILLERIVREGIFNPKSFYNSRLITWKEVGNRYRSLFSRIRRGKKASYCFKDVVYGFHFKTKTLYLKKRIRNAFKSIEGKRRLDSIISQLRQSGYM